MKIATGWRRYYVRARVKLNVWHFLAFVAFLGSFRSDSGYDFSARCIALIALGEIIYHTRRDR